MNNYIAAIDFGTQKIRVLVEYKKEIVFEKDYLIPVVIQSIQNKADKLELSKRGLKSVIAEDVLISKKEKHTPYTYYSNFFKHILSDIPKKTEPFHIAAILIVPELYSEIQRFTLKEIVEKVGFNPVKILNYSKLCAESLELNGNSLSEIISIGADYASFSLIRHDNGMTQPLDMETKSGLGGFYLDKLLFDKIVYETGLKNLSNRDELTKILNKIVGDLEELKSKVLKSIVSEKLEFSFFNDSLKDIAIDTQYIQNCFQPFFSNLSKLQSDLIERNRNLIINQTILAGALTKFDTIKKALNIQSDQIIYIESDKVLKCALNKGRDEIIDLMEKGAITEVKQKVLDVKQSTKNPDVINSDWSTLLGSMFGSLQELLTTHNFSNAESVLLEIEEIKNQIKGIIFSQASYYYYKNNDFLNAFDFIKKALAMGKNEEVIVLFENIVFKEVERLHGLNRQSEIKSLLKDAKEIKVSDKINEAFIIENRKFNLQNPSYTKGSNYTFPKKKKKH